MGIRKPCGQLTRSLQLQFLWPARRSLTNDGLFLNNGLHFNKQSPQPRNHLALHRSMRRGTL